MNKKANHLILGIFLLLIIFSSNYSPLCAQTEIQDSLVTVRLQYLENRLEHDKANTNRWWYGWLVGYSTATIGQGIVCLNSNDLKMRQDMALGAATTFLGAAGQFVSPVKLSNEMEQFNSIPANTPGERLNKLPIAEQLLNECGKREKLARNWKNHALYGVVNLGGGLITWLGFKRSIDAGIGYFALNTVITEAQIWSQPTLARRSYKKYRQKYMENESGIASAPEAKWYLEAYPGGIGIKVVF